MDVLASVEERLRGLVENMDDLLNFSVEESSLEEPLIAPPTNMTTLDQLLDRIEGLAIMVRGQLDDMNERIIDLESVGPSHNPILTPPVYENHYPPTMPQSTTNFAFTPSPIHPISSLPTFPMTSVSPSVSAPLMSTLNPNGYLYSSFPTTPVQTSITTTTTSQNSTVTTTTTSILPTTPISSSSIAKVNEDVKQTTKPVLKPRDIVPLELSQLQNLEARARLQMFFEAVEQSVAEDESRLQVAMYKMDTRLSVMIHTARTSKKVKTWEQLKEFLRKEFEVKLNFDEVWHETEQQYDWHENPYGFAQNFKCQYSSIEGHFEKENLPARDKMIKKLMLNGFPKNVQNSLSPFIDDKVPLDDFLVHVQYQRNVLLKVAQTVNGVHSDTKSESVEKKVEIPKPVVEFKGGMEKRLEQLENRLQQNSKEVEVGKRLDRIEKMLSDQVKVSKEVKNKKTGPYCNRCQNHTHYYSDCWYRRYPQRGRGKGTNASTSNNWRADAQKPALNSRQEYEQTKGSAGRQVMSQTESSKPNFQS